MCVIVAQGMPALIDCELLVVTGKGGVGRSSVAAALAMAIAGCGRKTIACEVGAQSVIPTLFGFESPAPGSEVNVAPNLAATTIDPDRALEEWIRAQVGATVGRALSASRSFSHFVAAAPGARELVTITKAWELGPGRRWGRGKTGHDLVVLDAPASGHGTAMLTAPRTFADIAGAGPIRDQAERVWDLIVDPSRTAIVGVTTLSELPVGEMLELDGWLDSRLGRRLDLVVANRCDEGSFSDEELGVIDRAAREGSIPPGALAAARLGAGRVRAEAGHLRELRQGLISRTPIVRLPEVARAASGRDFVDSLAACLAPTLEP